MNSGRQDPTRSTFQVTTAGYTPDMSEREQQRGFLPDFCDVRLLFAWVITAEMLALVLTLAAFRDNFWQHLSQRSLYIQWIALMLAGSLCLLGPRLNRLGHAAAGLCAWGLGLTVLVHLAVQCLLHGNWTPDPVALAEHLAIAAIVLAVSLRYLYELHRRQERELAEARAQAAALQARIRPHFLFNSMNTIANLTRTDPALAEQVVEDLSDLFRASLADGDRRSTLGDELEMTRGYLRIKAQRLGERLRVRWDLQDALPLHAHMPPCCCSHCSRMRSITASSRSSMAARSWSRCVRAVVCSTSAWPTPSPGARTASGAAIAWPSAT